MRVSRGILKHIYSFLGPPPLFVFFCSAFLYYSSLLLCPFFFLFVPPFFLLLLLPGTEKEEQSGRKGGQEEGRAAHVTTQREVTDQMRRGEGRREETRVAKRKMGSASRSCKIRSLEEQWPRLRRASPANFPNAGASELATTGNDEGRERAKQKTRQKRKDDEEPQQKQVGQEKRTTQSWGRKAREEKSDAARLQDSVFPWVG